MLVKQRKAYVEGIASGNLLLPKIIWDSSTLIPTAVFNGTSVTCMFIGQGIKNIHKDLEDALCKILKLDSAALHSLSLKGLKEKMGDTTPGNNFSSYNLLMFRDLRVSLMERLRSDPGFFLRTWLEWVDDLVGPLLTLVHLAAGMPGRSTEYPPLIGFNDTGRQQRSVYITMGRLCFVFDYNKAQTQSGKSRVIPRFLDPISSRLWAWFLGVVQPIYW